jgi:regulator of sigma E protease
MDGIVWVLKHLPEFIILISVVITVHELGHYWVGRAFGAAVESFSIGFGSSIFEVRDKRGTRWRVNWLPLGGFVKFVGEMQVPTDSTEDTRERSATSEHAEVTPEAGKARREKAAAKPVKLVGKPYTDLGPWPRIAVSLGGPFANFVFAIFVFAMMGFALGVPQAKEVLITGVERGTPADVAGFKPGDIILQAGGRAVKTGDDVIRATQLSAGEEVRYQVRRQDEVLNLVATPVEQDINNSLGLKQRAGRVGLQLGQRDTSIRNLNPIEAIGYGFTSTGDALGATINVLRRLVTGKEGLQNLSGPVGILSLTGSVSEVTMNQEGVPLGEKLRQLALTFLQLAALLSIGVGFFNLLPIPVLDGGAVVMQLGEAVTGKPIPEKVQQVGLTIGLVCLVTFALLITFQDVQKLPGMP